MASNQALVRAIYIELMLLELLPQVYVLALVPGGGGELSLLRTCLGVLVIFFLRMGDSEVCSDLIMDDVSVLEYVCVGHVENICARNFWWSGSGG